MNKVTVEPYERTVSFAEPVRKAKVEAIRIESNWTFLQSSQPVDYWKERET